MSVWQQQLNINVECSDKHTHIMDLLRFYCHCFNGELNNENISKYENETGFESFTTIVLPTTVVLMGQIGIGTSYTRTEADAAPLPMEIC